MVNLEASPLSDHNHILEWKNLSLQVPKNDKVILYPQSGSLRSREILAIMGPSGAGKTSFLDVVSQRVLSSDSSASITFDGQSFSMRDIGSYVAQEDALHGFLTVKDNIRYSALFSSPHGTPGNVIDEMVKKTLGSLGLTDVRKNRIGAHFQRGISGGQKRRVTIASSVVAQPQILLCDEPTSGLDSMTGYQVASAIKRLAEETNTVVLASIHQPNFETFSLFDHVLFLAGGHCVYQGPTTWISMPPHMNPADHVINLINTDFDAPGETGIPNHERVEQLVQAWIVYSSGSESDGRDSARLTSASPGATVGAGLKAACGPIRARTKRSWHYRFVGELKRTWILTKRTALVLRRNVVLVTVRVAMYGKYVAVVVTRAFVGLLLWNGKGFMSALLATVWLHMEKTDARVNDRISVHFFSLAFFSAMSVSAVPLYLEERAVFIRESNNGLYGAGVYTIANTVVFVPYIFFCALLYSGIGYWAIGLKYNGWAFCRFVLFLFLAVYAAEAQALAVAAVIPSFVGALAGVGFLIGFWLTFAFSLLVQNDFEGETFTCATLADGSCHCSFPSSLISKGQCAVAGSDILKSLAIDHFSPGFYAGALVIICFVYRLVFYLVLRFRKSPP
ncbi:hypothetical protein BS47DRAFT_1389827 [Hydnum rufescens UP504]|uniref:ABC transporter domain-containing protein n=1 Tax=Hydnum rufescens UP504 TaxID=1448309 RepID=A0A9P6B4T4_9AGAM|nr:hypothetical protein BS47DRAFT_1389827 [Hydnum rufescens UP504]